MCKETLQLVKNMDMHAPQVQLAIQCAPTITGIRLANLFIISSEAEHTVRLLLKQSGISCYRLFYLNKKTVFLLYRRKALEEYLKLPQVRDILFSLGYQDFSFGGILRKFQKRYIDYVDLGAGFPHEMGLLLGYPWEDVLGFMKNSGENSLLTGYWKVYTDAPAKKKLFEQYDKAQTHLIRLLKDDYEFSSILEIYYENRKRAVV